MFRLRTQSRATSIFVLALVASILAVPVVSGASPSAQRGTRVNLLKKVGTTTLAGAAASRSGVTVSDIPDELALAVARKQRPHSQKVTSYNTTTVLPNATNKGVSASNVRSWQGLNEFDNRYSGGGQYSSEPADLGMCTNGNYVMELVNSALQVYSSKGSARFSGVYQDSVSGYTGPRAIDLNSFFGQPPAVDRSGEEPTYGPSLFDITCLYDDASGRWFAVTAMLEGLPDGSYTGENSTLVAVSSGASPMTSSWNVYQLDTTNDGVDANGDPDGSPDHDCADNGYGASQCFGDYPQIGLDANGFYVTTNEFDWWGTDFNGAQVYALSKADLIAGSNSPRMVLYSGDYDGTSGTKGVSSVAFSDEEAYTLQPVNALASERVPNRMFFGSSLAWYFGTSVQQFSMYTLEHTEELLDPTPDLGVMLLSETLVSTGGTPYGLPPKARQKVGNTPTLSLYNSGYFGRGYPKIDAPIPLDTGSGKFYGAWLDNGFVFLTTATEASGSGGATMGNYGGTWKAVNSRSAIALFVVDVTPEVATTVSDAEIAGVSGQNLSYPSVAVNTAGKGAIGSTLSGPSYFPSAVFLSFETSGSGVVSLASSFGVARAGVGPNDGYTGWYPGYWRSRWGDYGATGVDSSGAIWMAAGYIAQTCTTSQFLDDPRCGYTRDFYANWSTAIYRYVP